MKFRNLLPALAVSMLTTHAYAAASVEINWKDPESYTDVRPSNESRSGFQKRTFAALEKTFVTLAEALPDGQKLTITVTNLDLAGEVWPSSFVGLGQSAASDVRLIKRIDIPRMKFSYTLTDANGAELKSADVSIKDMGFMDGINRHFNSDPLRYEKAMIEDWFGDELAPQTAQK